MDGTPGYGFRPSDDELVGFHLCNKIQGVTEHVQVINEVNICSFDPWDLRFQSKIKSRDLVWYFFSSRNASGNQQSRTTQSGYWKLTGVPVAVKDRRGVYCGKIQGKEIGHKRVLGFHKGTSSNPSSKGTKSDWVIHEYHYTLLPPDKRTYVICRLEYKGDDINILSYDPIPTYGTNNSLAPVVHQSLQGKSESHNTFSEYDSANQDKLFSRNFNMPHSVQGSEGSSFECPELGNPRQFSGFLDEQEETLIEVAVHRAFNRLSPDDWRSLFNDDDEQGKIMFMQQDLSLQGNSGSHNINILSYDPTYPIPTYATNNSPGPVVHQSLQGNSGSHNTFSEYDSANQDQLFSDYFNMPQSVQGNSGSFNYTETLWDYDYLVTGR